MRILLTTPEYPPYRIGGVGRYSYEVSHALAKRHTVDVLNVPTYQFNSLSCCPETSIRWVDVGGIRCCRLVRPELVNALQNVTSRDGLDALRRIYKDMVIELSEILAPQYDVVYVQEYTNAPLGGMLHYEGVAEAIVSACHLPLCAGFTYFDRTVQDDVQQILEAMMFRISDVVVVPSAFAASVVKKIYNVTKGRVVVNPLGVSVPGIRPPKREANDALRIGSVGRFTEQKGLHYLVDLVVALRDIGCRFECVLIGSGEGRDRFDALLKKADVEHLISVEGPLQEDAIFSFYRTIDIFVSTSLYETFGLAVLEAMACSCPSVGFDVGALSEILGDTAPALLAQTGDVRALATLIADLSSDLAARKFWGDKCRHQASGFSWDKHARRLEDTFEKVMP